MSCAFTVLSDIGRVRSGNEDRVHGRLDPHGTRGLLLVVADGLGGAAAGEVASAMAVETIDAVYFTAADDTPAERLRRAMFAANDRIAQIGAAQATLHGMGTTCTALAIVDQRAYLAHVGDSRAYRLRQRTITRLTRDMSVWAERVRGGASPASEYGRNQLSEVVGLDALMRPEMREDLEALAGDRFLLCSDGLWGLVTDPELLELVDRAPLDHACRALVDLANRRGGPDNISVVLAAVGEHSTAATP